MLARRHYFKTNLILSKFAIFIAVALLSGCASVKIDEYQHKKFNNDSTQVKDGLLISINPIKDHEESKKYFGRDILDSGVLAIHILIENDSSSADYIFEKDKIYFNEGNSLDNKNKYVDDKQASNDEKNAGIKATVGGLTTVLATPLALPLYLSGLSDIRNLNDIKYNMISKELKTKIVHHDEKVEGFLYFNLKDINSLKMKNNRIDISYEEIGNDKQKSLEFIF